MLLLAVVAIAAIFEVMVYVSIGVSSGGRGSRGVSDLTIIVIGDTVGCGGVVVVVGVSKRLSASARL